MRPNPLVTRKYLARGAQLWIGARLLVSALVVLAGMDPLRLTLPATILILAGSFAIGIADVYRRHERALLENLAVSRTALVLFLSGPAMIGELSITVVASLRG